MDFTAELLAVYGIACHNLKLDLEYRKEWDKLILSMEVVDVDSTTGGELISWIEHFPVYLHILPLRFFRLISLAIAYICYNCSTLWRRGSMCFSVEAASIGAES